MLSGRSASSGIAVGLVVLVQHQWKDGEFEKIIDSRDIVREQERLDMAVVKSRTDLQAIYDRALKTMGADEASIFEAHLMILGDPEFIPVAREEIATKSVSAEYSLEGCVRRHVALFESMDNEYMRARASDIKDIGARVLNHLLGRVAVDLSHFDQSVVIVADDLTPSEVATLDTEHVVGLLTEKGGRNSHVAILARTLEIPMVVGLKGILSECQAGVQIAFDGEIGEVYVKPDSQTVLRLQSLKAQHDALRVENEKLIGLKSVTLDGREVTLAANIGSPDDTRLFKRHDPEGVGLFRTEFLFMNRDQMPTEEEQFKAYRSVLETCGNNLSVIRTLDIGGDKKLTYFKMEDEENPFLGNRAIRLCLRNLPIFKVQLRALMRASHYGRLAIMFPMISCLEELLEAKAVLAQVCNELKQAGKPFDSKVQVGIMIEIPSAALISDTLAQHCDFFSIGTNDLIQYCCAVDRMNKNLESLYSPYHPGVLRLIQLVIKNAKSRGIWVGICGEIGGKPDLVPLLLGMGLDEFSMSSVSILPIRKLIRTLNYDALKKSVDEILSLPTSAAVEARLAEI